MTTPGPRSARPSAAAADASSRLLYDSVLPWSGGRPSANGPSARVAPGTPVQRRGLMRVLAVAQRGDLLEPDGQRRRVRVVRAAGRSRPAATNRAGQLLGDARVVGGGVREGLERQLPAQAVVEPGRGRRARRGSPGSAPDRVTMATLAWFLAAARTIDGPPMSISSMSSSIRDARSLERRGERVEVDDDELERGDAGGDELLAMVGQPAIGEEPAVDPRVERLDPAVEHLRGAGHRGHVGHRQAGVAQRPGGAAGRHELEPARDEPAAELHQAGLVRHRQEGAARDGDGAHRPRPGRCVVWRPSSATRTAPATSRPTMRGSSRCSTAWMRVAQARPRRRRAGPATASWATIGPPSRVASTRWTVTPVTATPCVERVAHGVRARERRQQRRMGVDDAAADTRRAPAARSAAGIRPARRHRAGRRPAPRPARRRRRPGTRAVSIPCSAAQSSAGQARSATTRTISPPSSPRAAAACERAEVGAGPGDGDRDPRRLAHATDPSGPSA